MVFASNLKCTGAYGRRRVQLERGTCRVDCQGTETQCLEVRLVGVQPGFLSEEEKCGIPCRGLKMEKMQEARNQQLNLKVWYKESGG